MDMFLALPEIYKRDYILQMLNGGQPIHFSVG
uniref:MLLE-like domain-containing protein n=2 Tax=Arundinoideae TaxID=156631 RepID=A0A0A9B9Z8_ARUDO